jgi:trk system potassium uptake protein TrkH
MFVRGSPGSTAGGIKTTTVGALFAYVLAKSRGRDSVSIFRRTIPAADLTRAVTIAAAASMVLLIGVLGLLLTDGAVPPTELSGREPSQDFSPQRPPHTALFLELLFEASSALGTVGLSTGIPSDLSEMGRLIIIVMMFVGRVGPLAIAVAIGQHHKPGTFRYPEEHVLVG